MSYPYNPRALHPDLVLALAHYAPYATSTAVEKIIAERDLRDGNSLLCWAHLIWTDALAAEIDDDIVQLGAEASAVLAQIGADDPSADAATRLAKQIASRVKRARRELAKIERLDALPEDALSLEQSQELAFLLSACECNNPAIAAKAYRLWMRSFREVPDVHHSKSTEFKGRVDEYHGHNYFYLQRAAESLWWTDEREEARALFARLLDWPVRRDVELYNAAGSVIALLLLESVARRDVAEMTRLLDLLREKHDAVGELPTLAMVDVDVLLAFAVEVRATGPLRYIVEVLMRDRSVRSLSPSARANLAAAKHLLTTLDRTTIDTR